MTVKITVNPFAGKLSPCSICGQYMPRARFDEYDNTINAHVACRDVQEVATLRADLGEEKLLRGIAEKSGIALFEKNRQLIIELQKARSLIGAVLVWMATFKEKYHDDSADEKYLELTAYTAAHKETK